MRSLIRVGMIALCAVILSGCTVSTTGALELLGQEERIAFLDGALSYQARIDTGATTNSISATDIIPSDEEDGQWVSFRLPPAKKGEKAKTLRRKVTRIVTIKRHGTKGQDRYAVKLRGRIGSIDGEFEFTLTDRNSFEFPVLIGRNFLEGRAVVDVSRRNAAGTAKVVIR